MPIETGIIPDQLQGNYFQDPELFVPQQTGILDLISTDPGQSGQTPQYDPVQNSLDNFENTKTSVTTMAAPKFFDWDRSQADRYVSSDNYKQLGFDPELGQENEYKYGRAQTWGDVWGNGLTGMFKLASNTFIEGWKGWGHMADAVSTWDSSKLVGTPEQLQEQNKNTNDIMNKYAIYSTPETETGIFNRKFFGDMLQQSGFAVGTIAQFLSEELLTYGLSTEFSLAKLGMKAPSWAGRIVTKADVAKDIANLGDSIWKSRTVAEGLVQGARKYVPLFDAGYDMYKYGKAGAGVLQMASIGVGGVRRFLSEANMAMTEARMESAGTYGDLYTKLYDEELYRTGQAPSSFIESRIKRLSMDAAQDNFKVNTGILLLSNRLQFDNMFSKFKVGRKVVDEGTSEFADDILKVTGRALGKEGAEETTKLYTKGVLGTMGLLKDISKDFGAGTAAWTAAKSTGGRLLKIEWAEGIQELFQDLSNNSLQNYYYDLYHGAKGSNFKDSLSKAFEEEGKNNQGMKTFLMGAVTGHLLSPINMAVGATKKFGTSTKEQRAAHKDSVKDAVDTINSYYENPNRFLNEHIANIKTQNEAGRRMEVAIYNKDPYQYTNFKDSAFSKLMATSMKTGMFSALTDNIRGYADTFNDKEFKEAFGVDKNEAGITSVKAYFDKVATEMEDYQTTWKNLKEKFSDLVIPDLYKDGTPEHKIATTAKKALDDALEVLATNDYKSKRAAERAVKIQTDMASKPVYGSSVATSFRNLGVLQNTKVELDILQKELEAAKAIENKDQSTKDLIKSKEAQIKSLTTWYESHQSLLEKDGSKGKNLRTDAKAKKAFQEYMNSKNAESKINTVIKTDDVEEIYSNLMDYMDLNKDHKDYIDAYNIVANPINFVKVHGRIIDAINHTRERFNAEHIQEAIEAIEKEKAAASPKEQKEKAPDFNQYLKDTHEGQLESGGTDLPFEEWRATTTAKVFTDLYNKKYGTNFKIEDPKEQTSENLSELENEINNADFLGEDYLGEIMSRISKILNISIKEAEDLYIKFHESMDQTQLQADLMKLGADKSKSVDEVVSIFNKHVIPLFIDELLKRNQTQSSPLTGRENHEIIELPSPKTILTKPNLKAGEVLLDNGKNGIFIIQHDGKFSVVNSERNSPIDKQANICITKTDALAERDAFIKKIADKFKKDRSYYTFGGMEIRAGLVMTRNSDGKRFVVYNLGEPYVAKNADGSLKLGTDGQPIPPTIKLIMLSNNSRTNSPVYVKAEELPQMFTIKQKEEKLDTGETVSKDTSRLYRTTELSRIYPHVNRDVNESEEDAQRRLDTLLKNTPAADLQKGMSIKITKGASTRTSKNVTMGEGMKANPNLFQFSDKYKIEMVFQGQTIGYLTNYDNLRYITDNGVNIPIENLTLDQFRTIFDSKGKDPRKTMDEFKTAYRESKKVFNELSNYVKGDGEIVISPEQLRKILIINTEKGEYDFVDKKDAVTYQQLSSQKINGFYYIIDRSKRYGKGYSYTMTENPITDATGKDRQAIEKEVDAEMSLAERNNSPYLGRYVAVVKMNDGKIRFLNLSTETVSDEKLNDFITKINERTALTKEKNLQKSLNEKNEEILVRKGVDFNTELNSELATGLFITVPAANVGTYVDFGVSDTGNLELSFHKKIGNEDIRRKIRIYGKTLSDAVVIKDINDLVQIINDSIKKHDKDLAQREEDKIGIEFTRENFKESTPDTSEFDDVKGLKTSVSAAIVKNVPITVIASADIAPPVIQTKSATTGGNSKPVVVAPGVEVTTNEPTENKIDAAKKAQIDAILAANSGKPVQAPKSEGEETELDKLNKEIKRLEQEKELESTRRREIKLADTTKNITVASAIRESTKEAAIIYDPQIKELKKKVNDLRKNQNQSQPGKVLKVTTKTEFDEASVVNIDKFKKYISRILGDVVDVETMEQLTDNLKTNNITVGQFTAYMEILKDGNKAVKGLIQVGEKSGFKYHEAFHAVFRLMLSDEQAARLTGYAKIEVKEKLAKEGRTLKEELDEMRDLHTIYADMSEEELEERYYEEYMADRFDEFSLKNEPLATKTLPGIRGFFQKIWDFITSLFKKTSKNQLDSFFREVNRGKYKNSRVTDNKFTKPDALSITEPAMKAIKVGEIEVQDENGYWIYVDKYLNQQEGDQLASTIASIFHSRTFSDKRDNYNKAALLDEIFDDFIDLYNPEREFYTNEIERLYEIDPAQATEYNNKLEEKFNIFYSEENRQLLSESVDVHLRTMGYNQELEEDEYITMEDEFGSRYSTENWKEAHSIGGFGSLSKFLRQYIASTTFALERDDFGNTQFINGEPLLQAVNANLVYNGVLKAVANITDQKQFVARLLELKNAQTETGKFLEKFFDEVGLKVDKTSGEFVVRNPAKATLFQSVIKGFQQYTVDYIFINKDIRKSKKIARLMVANRMGSVKTQFSQWQNAYTAVYENELFKLASKEDKQAFAKSRIGSLQDIVTLLNPTNNISDEKLELQSQELSNQLKIELGISLSPLFIKYSIASSKKSDIQTEAQRKLAESYREVEGMKIDELKQLMKSIQALENPFAKNIDTLKEVQIDPEADQSEEVDDLGEGGSIARLTSLATGNAIFDETVSTTSYKNAEGELVYSHQLPTFHLVKINDLNSKATLDEMRKNDFLSNNVLLDSDKFEAMAGEFRVQRIEGMKTSILEEDKEGNLREDKTIQANQNKGIVYGSFSDREFLISLLEMYQYNKEYTDSNAKPFMTSQHLVRVVEASNTGDTVGLPVIKSVELGEDGKPKLTKEAIDILKKEVVREFERIQKVRTEITTKIFEDGEVEGYHYAIDENGNRTDKKKPRGLKFYKMSSMLGEELAAELEKLSEDSSFNLSSKMREIESRINEHWEDQFENFTNKLDNLGVITLSKGEAGEVIQNNLLDDFILKGFTSKENKKEIVDEKKNGLLNLIPGNLRHNLAQILVNDYINTLSINQLLYGDEARSFKDGIDQVKRAKGANGSGASIESLITAPSLGINKSFTKSHILTFTSPRYKAEYAGGLKEKADAQSYMTVKAARHTLFGLGKLTPETAAILDKIERGESLTSEEIFGKGGLKQMEAMFNSMKLVYFDGPQYIKTSTVMLTKEFTSTYVDGEWVAAIGSEELHDLRERMEKFERDNDTVVFSADKSASKGTKKNVFDHKLGFKSAKDENFVEQETKYWRLQLENPSNKLEITDPTQAKQIIIAEQDDTTEVVFNGVNTTVGALKELYLKDTDQRIKNNYFSARDSIFNIDKAFSELGKSIQQDKVSADLKVFQERAIETLRATGADSQMLEFFAIDPLTDKPKYNLNNPVTLNKYTQLFLAYFSKGVMSEKSPGHSVALMTNWGKKVVKRFTGKYMEDGTPIGEVIPSRMVNSNYSLYKDAKRWDNDISRKFTGLNPGDFYVDDLRHNVPEFDANGKIIGRYTEYIMPAHFVEDMNLDPTKPIPDHIAQAFGVRIPSQDKHSFITLKLVDFMPAYYGSTAILPHELIEISGADFDIDKLYMHISDTYVKKGQRIPYGTETSKEGRFEEFVRFQSNKNKQFKKTLKELKKTDPIYRKAIANINSITDLKEAFRELLQRIPESEKTIREGMQTAVLISRFIDDIIANEKGISFEQYRDRLNTVEEAYFLDDLSEMMGKLDLRELQWAEREYGFDMADVIYNSFKDLKQFINNMKDRETVLISEALKTHKLPSNIIDYSKITTEQNNGVLNNRILKQKMLMLNNEHMTKGGNKAIAFEVASVKGLSDLLDPNNPDSIIALLGGEDNIPKELRDVLLEGNVDVDSMFGKYVAFKNNKEGSRNIGPAVNSMLVYSILNNFNIQLRDTYFDTALGVDIPMYKFKLNGHTFDGYGQTKSFNFETGKYDSNFRIFNTISTIVSAMTDNAKERLAARLGLNIEAVGYVSNMVAQGIPLKSAITFILQPVIREYFELSKVASNNIKTAAESEIYKSQIASGLLEEYIEKAGEDYVKEDLTDEMMLENIKNNGASAIYQASILEEFMGLQDQSQHYASVAQILKLTKGLGTSFEDYDKINEKIESLGLRVKNDQLFERFVSENTGTPPAFDLRQVLMGYDENKPHHNFVKGYIDIADQLGELSKGMFIQRTAVFKRMVEIAKDNLFIKNSVKQKFNDNINEDLIAYLSIKAYRKYLAENGRTATLASMTNALIYDEAAEKKGDEFMDIVDTMRLIRDRMPNNHFVNNYLNVVATSIMDAGGEKALNPKNKDGINKIEANTWAKLNEYQVEKLKDSFIEIYQSELDFGNGKNGREMANTLFNYLLVKDGGRFKSGSYIRFIPNFMFDELLQSTGKANDLMKLSTNATNAYVVDEEYKKVFGVTSLELFNEFMANYNTHVSNGYYVKRYDNLYKEPAIPNTGNAAFDKYNPKSVIVSEDNTTIKINIFRGARESKQKVLTEEEEAGVTLMSDEDYFEYLDSLTDAEREDVLAGKSIKKAGGYNEDEKERFKKNMAYIDAKGFKRAKNNQITFPYIIKVPTGEFFGGDNYYILRGITKPGLKKGDKSIELDSKKLIQKGETVASGIGARYELIERKGSAKTFAGAGVIDEIPATATLPRYRRPINNSGDFGIYHTKEKWFADPDAPAAAVGEETPKAAATTSTVRTVDTGGQKIADVIYDRLRITFTFVAGKGFEFKGELYDLLPADVKARIFSPVDLLRETNIAPNSPSISVYQPTKVEQSPVVEKITEAPAGPMTPEAIKKLIALRQSGVKEQPSSSSLTPEKIEAIKRAIAGNDVKSVQDIDPQNPLNDECNGLGGEGPSRVL